MAPWKGRLGKSADFHRDVLKGVSKRKSDTDKQVCKKSEKKKKKDQRDLSQKYATQLYLKCSSICLFVISVILNDIFCNFIELCNINSLKRSNFEANIII